MKNPKECFSLCQNQTFFILNQLTPPEYKDSSEPLLFHHDTFSRFVFVIIHANKKAATANIPVDAVPFLLETTKNLNFRDSILLPSLAKDGHPEPQSPAYTTIITSGTLKGKTPASALLENASKNKPLLLNQRRWLQQNLPKYPKNQEQITAIEEALTLFDNGKLDGSLSAACPAPETIYSTGMRPLIRRKKENGKCFVYEISIVWNAGVKKPFEITIRNYYAPVIKTESGLLNVQAQQREEEIKNTFSLTPEETLWMLHMLETNLSTFENIYARKNYETANAEERKILEEFKKSKSTVS